MSLLRLVDQLWISAGICFLLLLTAFLLFSWFLCLLITCFRFSLSYWLLICSSCLCLLSLGSLILLLFGSFLWSRLSWCLSWSLIRIWRRCYLLLFFFGGLLFSLLLLALQLILLLLELFFGEASLLISSLLLSFSLHLLLTALLFFSGDTLGISLKLCLLHALNQGLSLFLLFVCLFKELLARLSTSLLNSQLTSQTNKLG